MKVLLINPNSSLINRSWAYRRFFTPIAPLGLAYIAAVFEKNGIETFIFDQFANKASDKELISFIKEIVPNVVGFSALTPVISDIKRLAKGIRELNRDIRIILGNIHATCFPEEVIEQGIADIVVRGEGEMTMLELCKLLDQKNNLDELPGITFKSDGQIIHNSDSKLINDLDLLPFPAWHLLNPDDYTEVPLAAISGARAFPILASRGCPYRCYYCSQDKIYDRVRYRDLNKVVDEMEYFNRELDIKYFGFTDAYFPYGEESGLEFCNIVIKRGLHKKIKWATETRVDKVTPALLKAMKEAGAHLIMYGVEVGNARILESLNKGTTLEQAKLAFKETKKARILSQGLFILGLPEETIDTCRDTIDFAKNLDCDIVKFNLAMPYPGSRFFEDYRKTRIIHNPESFTSWYDWLTSYGNLVYTPAGMDSRTLRYLQRKAMLDFYLRPRVIIKNILRRTITCKNIFYGGLWLISLFCYGIIKRLRQQIFGIIKKI